MNADDMKFKPIKNAQIQGVNFTSADAGLIFEVRLEGETMILEHHIEAMFLESFNEISKNVHNLAIEKGWWDQERNELELIALIMRELGEAIEAVRDGNPPSDKIPAYSGLEEELADTIIRIMDMGDKMGLRLSSAIVAKHEYNKGRAFRHGGKLY